MFGDRDELIGGDGDAVAGPPGEGFEAAQFAGDGVGDGLVVQAQVAGCECVAQRCFEVGLDRQLGASLFVEDLDAAPAEGLGAVDGVVGVADQVERGGMTVEADADADAGADTARDPVELDRFADAGDESLGELDGVADRCDAFGDDEELVTAEAGEQIAGANGALHPVRAGAQDPVADVMAVGVVGAFEPIEVDEQHDHGVAVTMGAAERHLESLECGLAVREPGEQVVVGLVGESLLELFACLPRVQQALHGGVHRFPEWTGCRHGESWIVEIPTREG